jgi:beta-galactosidase
LGQFGPLKVDIQKCAIVQNGENVATEKTGRTDLTTIGTAWYRNTLLCLKIQKEKILLLLKGYERTSSVFRTKKVGEWAYGYSYFLF